MSELLDKIMFMLANEVKAGKTGLCQKQCEIQLKNPVVPFVGKFYHKAKPKIVFLRFIPDNSWPDNPNEQYQDFKRTLFSTDKDWKSLRMIAESIFGSDAFDSVAVVNMIQCRGNPTKHDSLICIDSLRLLYRILKILQPDNIVSTTYNQMKILDLPGIPGPIGHPITHILNDFVLTSPPNALCTVHHTL